MKRLSKSKVLFLSFGDYPHSGACVSLIRKLAAQEGFHNAAEVHVLAPRYNFSQTDTEIIDGVTVHRFLCWDTISQQRLRQRFPRAPLSTLSGVLQKATLRVRREYFKRDFLDSFTIRSISRALASLSNEAFDVLIPVAGYYDSVQAAMRFMQHHPARLIIYQVDPCSSNQAFDAHTSKKRRTFERRMYAQADAVITTPILLRELRNTVSDDLLKKAVAMEFPNVSPKHDKGSNEQRQCTGDYVCVFAGSIYSQARNPAYTFKLFFMLREKHIRLRMIGVEKKAAAVYVKNGALSDNVEFYGTVPLEQAQKHMEEADVLINIGNIMTNQVPSKIFEYISSGKPIVNICTSHDCPTQPYLEKYPYVLNLFECDTDFDAQVQKLEAFIKENAGKRVSADYIMQTYEKCTAQYCAKQMIDVIKRVVE